MALSMLGMTPLKWLCIRGNLIIKILRPILLQAKLVLREQIIPQKETRYLGPPKLPIHPIM